MNLLSIIIPVYNAEDTIERTLSSLNKIQPASKELCEAIIINDGSQDRSVDIIESKKEDLAPLDIILKKQKNKGTASARNNGLNHCRGEWIFFLDADDELAFDPVPFIKQSQGSSCLGFRVKLFRHFKYYGRIKPVLINAWNHLNIVTAKNPFTTSSVIFKKSKVQSYFVENLIYMEDWLFWLSNPMIFEDMKIFPDTTSAILHSHGRNKSSDHIMNGKYRKIVADKMLAEPGNSLTRRQKNNLMIQSCIGSIQQGKRVSSALFSRIPCDPVLYGKLMFYFFLRERLYKLNFYGRE